MRTAAGVKIGGWSAGQSVGHRAGDEGFAEAGARQRPHGLTGLRHISVGIDQGSDIIGFDVGCAGGNSQAAGVDCMVVGLDEDPAVFRGAGKYHQVLGDAKRMPLAVAVFDYVLCHHVLEHIDDPAPALREVSRVLKPDGGLSVAGSVGSRSGVVSGRFLLRLPARLRHGLKSGLCKSRCCFRSVLLPE